MKYFVTGVGGQLGHDVMNELASRGYEGVGSDIQPEYSGVQDGTAVCSMPYVQLDITDKDAVDKVISEVAPDVIVHCAAWTAVDLAEDDDKKELVHKINAEGTANIAKVAKKIDAKMVYISTDYVFKGDGTKPYIEFDTPNPNSMYGTTKLAGEKFVQEFSDKHFIIRTAWLYGDGKNFVKTMLRLAQNGPEVNVVGDQIGSPTSTKVLADIIETLLWTDNYGLFHGTCEGICSWADFTDEIFKLTNTQTKVNHITTEKYQEMFPASAKRPAYSVLDNYMLKLTDTRKEINGKKRIVVETDGYI